MMHFSTTMPFVWLLQYDSEKVSLDPLYTALSAPLCIYACVHMRYTHA